MSGYGILEEEARVRDYILKVKYEGEIAHYSRYKGSELIVSKTIVKPTRFEIVPFYPIMLPTRFTNYILIVFTRKIAVSTRGEALIFIKVPVDIAVYAYGAHRKFLIIDVFSINKIKYALYGVPDRGVIARYWVSEPLTEIPESSLGEAVSLVHIRNRYDGWVEIGKILLDVQILKLYYVPHTWNAYTQVITMAVNSPSTATIYYGRRIEAGARPIRDPPDLRPPRILAKTEMLWGLK